MWRILLPLPLLLLFLTDARGGVPEDKVGHFMGGFLIGGSVSAMSGEFSYGCAASIGAGILKEVLDGPAGGHQEVADAVATGLGGCLGAGLSVRVDKRDNSTPLVYDQFKPDLNLEGLFK